MLSRGSEQEDLGYLYAASRYAQQHLEPKYTPSDPLSDLQVDRNDNSWGWQQRPSSEARTQGGAAASTSSGFAVSGGHSYQDNRFDIHNRAVRSISEFYAIMSAISLLSRILFFVKTSGTRFGTSGESKSGNSVDDYSPAPPEDKATQTSLIATDMIEQPIQIPQPPSQEPPPPVVQTHLPPMSSQPVPQPASAQLQPQVKTRSNFCCLVFLFENVSFPPSGRA
jgi:hypothetical protein